MFRNASLFIGTSFTVAVFTIFATSNVDSFVGIPHKKFNAKNLNPQKKPISLLNVLICTQGMQRTWWPEAGTILSLDRIETDEVLRQGWFNDDFRG